MAKLGESWHVSHISVKLCKKKKPTYFEHSLQHHNPQWLMLINFILSCFGELVIPFLKVLGSLRVELCPSLYRADPTFFLRGIFFLSTDRNEFYFDPTWNKQVFSLFPTLCFKQNWNNVFVLFLLGFQPDEEMSEIFKTEFQMRLLWGSKGAQVNQTERYEKFNQILTALSRKLEPPPVKQAELWSLSRGL